MKRIGILLSFLFILGLSSNVYSQRAIKKGFSIGLFTGFPSDSYGANSSVDPELQYGALFGLQLGSRWYIAPQEKFGVGIMGNWFDFGIGIKSGTDAGQDWARVTMQISVLEFGPIGTFAINDDMAFDAYYNLCPTVMSTALVFDSDYGNTNGTTIAGTGFTHAIGTAFRWKVLNIGLEYVTGGISSDVSDVDSGDKITEITAKANQFRIILGVKF